ncbi:MAG: hypothetical protein IPO31_06560 [Candidatus Obscuribacter sp.]|nr:hypothetical protein [Candidatus Obscuribacter sp.]
MNPIQIIATLRKFGNYIAGIFPGLAKIVDFVTERLKRFVSQPALMPLWQRLYQIGIIKAFWSIFERFYWRTYAKDRLDLTGGPEECIVILRPIFQLCALICLLIPLSQINLAPQAVETFAGFKSTAPAWCIYLWIFALPCAWAVALTGAALSNRLIFVVVALGCLYFMSTCVLLSGRDPANALLGLTVLYALFISESKDTTRVKLTLSQVLSTLAVSIASAIQITILTPLRPLLGPYIPLPSETIGITIGTVLGTAIAVIVLRLSGKHSLTTSMAKIVTTLYSGLLLFLLLHLCRSSASASGGMLISSLSMTTSYFWPIWYFIGIGIMHKLMGSTKVVVQALDMAVPSRLLAPVMSVALLISLICTFADRLAYFFATQTGTGPLSTALCSAFAYIYHLCTPLIFSSTVATIGTHWLSLVLLFDLIVFVTLLMSKKLTADSVIRVFYMTCLAALLIWEYLFQYTSFARTPTHNILVVFLFALWLLWLMHTVGWSTSLKSSPLWPVRGRLALYAAVVLFCLLEIAAKSATKDFRIMNEIFLNMFRGVLDVGLPYYLYIWAQRRIKPLPTSVKSIFFAFTSGAVFAFILNPLDKLAASNWSLPAFNTLIEQQLQNLSNSGNITLDLSLPLPWLFARSILFVLAMLVLLYIAQRGKSNLAATSKTFLVVAFAGGVASFSRTFVDLPLPTYARVLLAPVAQDTAFNCTVFNTYLAYWIPALTLSCALLHGEQAKRQTGRLVSSTFFAALSCFVIFAVYLQLQEYLRASGLLYPYMTIIAVEFAALVIMTMQALERHCNVGTEQNVMLGQKQLVSLVCLVAIIATTIAAITPRLVVQAVPVAKLNHTVELDKKWSLTDASTSNTIFTTTTSAGLAFFAMGKVPSDKDGCRALLKSLLIKAATSGNFPNMQILDIASYEQYKKDAVSCHFTFDRMTQAGKALMMGMTVLYPRGAETEYYTLCAAPTDMDKMEWEMALLIKGLK